MATFTREYERVTCPGCQRVISAYIPHFGDGSGLRLVKHNLEPGRGPIARERCSHSERIIVRDHGKWRLE